MRRRCPALLLLCLLLTLSQGQRAHAHGGEDHGAPATGTAAAATALPQTRFSITIVDASQNDPLLGGEAAVEKARVHATLTRNGQQEVSQDAHEEGGGVYMTDMLVDENGDHTLTLNITPGGSPAFDASFPIKVAGAPQPATTSWLSGWRLAIVVAIAMLLLAAVFTVGRITGRRQAAATAAVIVAVMCPSAVWAHGEDAAPAMAPTGPGSELRVGVGDIGTTKNTITSGKYKVTLTVQVLRPAAASADRIQLSAEQAKTIGLETVEVKPAAFDTGLSVTGSVSPDPGHTVTLSSRVAGRLRDVFATVGDHVRKGQSLAVIESADIAEAQSVYSTAQSAVLAQEAAYQQAVGRAGIAARQLAQQQELGAAGVFSQAPLQEAQKEQATAASDLAAARSQLAQAQADRATHRKSLVRTQQLFQDGIRSRADLEAAQLESREDDLKVDQARRQVDAVAIRARVSSDALSRQQRLAASNIYTRKELSTAQGTLDTARLEARQAEANLTGARRALESAINRLSALGAEPGSGNAITLRAPIAGIVTTRTASVGETVIPDKTLFNLVDPSVVWIEGDVFDKDLPRVHLGMRARMTSDALPGETFDGRVSYIAAVVDPTTRAYRVRVVVKNPPDALRIGMFVRALLVTEKQSQAIAVPDAAVQTDGGLKFVFVQEGDAYERRPVAVGASAAGMTEIKSGVEAGDKVVTVGSYQLKSIGKQQ